MGSFLNSIQNENKDFPPKSENFPFTVDNSKKYQDGV